MKAFGMHTTLRCTFEDARTRVTEALKNEGFGVLTEIDVQATLKKKLGVDFRPYVILGACNPPFAHRALTASLDVGLLLPCNVVLYDEGEGKIHVGVVDPMETIAAHATPDMRAIAEEVRSKLGKVVSAVGGT